MRFALAALITIAAPASAASAKLDISPAFKGTIVSSFPDGRHTNLWLAKDGSYRATSRDGAPSDGTWTIKDDERMCLRQKQPIAAPFDYCTQLPARLDRAWSGKSVTGLPVTIRLTKGGRPKV